MKSGTTVAAKGRWWAIGVLLGLVLIPLSQAANLDSGLDASISEHMKEKYYNETTAEMEVAEWGEGCVPILIDMLNASSGEAEKVAFYLGKTGSPSGIRPLKAYLKRLRAAGSTKHFGYIALGWIGTPEALEYLAQYAQDAEAPRRADHAIQGLEEAGNRNALARLEELKRTGSADHSRYLPIAITRCREEIEEREGLQRAENAKVGNATSLGEFWNRQSALSPGPPEEDIIGEYVGAAFWTDYFKDRRIDGVRIIFREDGVFETNLARLTNMERLRDKSPELLDILVRGRYRVLSRTQLVLGPGEGVSTFGFSLEEGRLSFFHRRLEAYFSLGKSLVPTPTSVPADIAGAFMSPSLAPVSRPANIAGVYRGSAFLTEEGSKQMREVHDVTLTFSANGYFSTNFGRKHGKLLCGFDSFDGTYLIDQYGKIVCFAKIHGGDFFGADATTFFDWQFQEGTLRVNHFHGANYGCALALSRSGEAVNAPDSRLLDELTEGAYVGRAFRTTPEGQIEELPGLGLQFSKDGTYSGNFLSVLRPKGQYPPADTGPYKLISDRQLFFPFQGICDALVSDNRLCFTSFGRKAYFVLEKEQVAE